MADKRCVICLVLCSWGPQCCLVGWGWKGGHFWGNHGGFHLFTPKCPLCTSLNCLDDAMVMVVTGIIPYALVFDVLHGFYSLFFPF